MNYWQALLLQSTAVQLKKGQTLFYKGHMPCGVFVVVAGPVNYFQETGHAENPVGQFSNFQPIGIDLLTSQQPYPFTAIASGDDVRAYFISKNDLMALQNYQGKGM